MLNKTQFVNNYNSSNIISQNINSDTFTRKELSNKRVLIIDSDIASNSYHCLFLTKMGFTKIDIARCGKEAIAHSTNIKYSLILIELILPDINGFKVCKSIRKINKNKDTTIIAATSYFKNKIIDACNSYNVCDVITKPFSYCEYRNILSSNLTKRISQ